MCGIVGGIAQRNVIPILVEGLKGWSTEAMTLQVLRLLRIIKFTGSVKLVRLRT